MTFSLKMNFFKQKKNKWVDLKKKYLLKKQVIEHKKKRVVSE